MVTETTPLFDDKTVDSHQTTVSVRRSSVSNSFREHHGAVPLPSRIPLEGLSASIKSQTEEKSSKGGLFYYLVYAAVNVIISVPGLYGYASVIFRHEAYADHMNALSKLVIFSSFIYIEIHSVFPPRTIARPYSKEIHVACKCYYTVQVLYFLPSLFSDVHWYPWLS